MAPHFGLRGQPLATARVLLIVVPSFLLFGYNQSAIGGVLGFQSFTSTFPRIDTVNTTGSVKANNSTVQGTVVAVYTLGCLMGALCSTIIGNKLGRRKTLVIGALWASIGLILQASSFSLAQMVIGRIVSGFGVGGVNAIVPVWQAECSKPKSRGKNVVIIGIFIATGIATAAWVNFGLSHIAESAVSWRLPLAIPLIFTMWIVAFAFCFPESPRWLVQQGRIHQAKQVMSILQNIPIDSSTIQMEIASIEQACEAESHRKASFKLIFTTGPQRLLYRAALAILVNFFAQMTGANAISYYATTIFRESLDFPASQSSLLAAGVLTWKIFAASLAYFIVDRFGRKPLFMVSGFGMSLSMTCLAICVSFIKAAAAGKAAVFFLFLYMTFFPLGFLGANFLYATEIAPQDLRVHFSAIGTATHWLFNFVIAEITPICFTNIGYQTYIIYAVVSAVVPLSVYFGFPETKGRSLEEMGQIFSSATHWWQVPKMAKLMPPGRLKDIRDIEKKDSKEHVELVAPALKD